MAINGAPPGLHNKLLATVSRHLTTHPYFNNGRVVKTWAVWSGRPTDYQTPTNDMGVWARLTLIGGAGNKRVASRDLPGSAARRSILTSNPIVLIELQVPNNNLQDFTDVGDRICDALVPNDPGERAAVAQLFGQVGIRDWWFPQFILPRALSDFAPQCIYGSGRMELTVQLDA